MSEDVRIERLERRVTELEELVGALAGKWGGGEAERVPPTGRPTPIPTLLAQTPTPPPDIHRGPPPSASPPPTRPEGTRAASPLSSEQWVGQRLLLAVGVTALIL